MIKEANLRNQIIKIGIICSVVFCALVFAMALYAHFYVPGSKLFSPEMLMGRMGSGIISYFLAAGFVFCAKFFFRNRMRAWVSVPLMGSVMLFLSFFSYIFIDDYFGKINCAQKIRFGECYLLSRDQTILAAVLAFVISSAIVGAVYFIIGYLYKTFLKCSILN